MLQVTVGKGSRDMYEGFELWHLTGHEQELLGGSNIELHGMSERIKQKETHLACIMLLGEKRVKYTYDLYS